MKLLDIGQGLFINPDYVVKIEKGQVSVGDRIFFTIDIYLALNINKGITYSSHNIERLSFESPDKRDEYFLYLFKFINGEPLS